MSLISTALCRFFFVSILNAGCALSCSPAIRSVVVLVSSVCECVKVHTELWENCTVASLLCAVTDGWLLLGPSQVTAYGGELRYTVRFEPYQRSLVIDGQPDVVLQGNGIFLEHYSQTKALPRLPQTIVVTFREVCLWSPKVSKRILIGL